MNFTREHYRLMREQLLKIVYWHDGDEGPRPRAQDKIEAAKNVDIMDLTLLSAEIPSGMYRNPSKPSHAKPTTTRSRQPAHGYHRGVAARGPVGEGDGGGDGASNGD